MFKNFIIIIGLITLLPTVCFAGKVNVKRLHKANWIHFETKNFNVLTDAEEERALELVRELEDFKYFLSTILQYKQKPLSQKVFVVAAKNPGTFKSTGIPGAYTGIFTKGYGDTIFVQCDGFRSSSKGKNNSGRTTVFHELVHLFIHNSFSESAIHPWYDEGMAEYFSTYMEKNGKAIIGDMGVHKNRFYSMLKTGEGFEKIDTEDLFKITRADLNIFNTNRRHGEFLDKFYARALIVVHYMLADTNRTKQLSQYIYSLNKGGSIDESFKHAFKMTFPELDREIFKYINGKDLNVQTFKIGKDGINFPVVKLKRQEITKRDALGFLFINIAILPEKFLDERSFDKLNSDVEKLYPGLINDILRQQLAEKPENILVLTRVANIYKKMNKYSEAIDLYERALLLDDTDAFTLNNYAWLLVTMDENELRNPARAIELAKKAVAIERSPDRLDTLAEAYYVNGTFQMAIKTINEAIAIGTGDNRYLKKQRRKYKKDVKN